MPPVNPEATCNKQLAGLQSASQGGWLSFVQLSFLLGSYMISTKYSIRGKQKNSKQRPAILTGILRRHISEMENNKRSIGKASARKLADVLHADYRVFL